MQQWGNKMQIKKLNSRAVVPSKSIDNAGFDLAVQIKVEEADSANTARKDDHYYNLLPNESKTFGTGLAIWLDNPRLVGLVLPRSKLGSKLGVVLGNLVGVLDSSYQGELMLNLWNRSDEPVQIQNGMLVAQLVVCEMPMCTHFTEVQNFDSVTKRGEQGINCDDIRAYVDSKKASINEVIR